MLDHPKQSKHCKTLSTLISLSYRFFHILKNNRLSLYISLFLCNVLIFFHICLSCGNFICSSLMIITANICQAVILTVGNSSTFIIFLNRQKYLVRQACLLSLSYRGRPQSSGNISRSSKVTQ